MNPDNQSPKPYRFPLLLLFASLYGFSQGISRLSMGLTNIGENLIGWGILLGSLALFVTIIIRHFKLRRKRLKVSFRERLRRMIGLTPSHCLDCDLERVESDAFCNQCGAVYKRTNSPYVIARAIGLLVLAILILAILTAVIEFYLNVMGNTDGFPVSTAVLVGALAVFYVGVPFLIIGRVVSFFKGE
jgi:hypothetical protein